MNNTVKIALYVIAAPLAFVGTVMSAGVALALMSWVFSAVGSVLSGFASGMYWVAENLLMRPALYLVADIMQVMGLGFFVWVIAAVVALIALHIANPNKTHHG